MKAVGMDGIAFAVPIDEVKRVVGQLRKHGRVLRPFLGLKFVELDPTVAASLRRGAAADAAARSPAGARSCPDGGLFVMHVAPDSPAARGGVRTGDTITGMGGAPMRTTRELIEGLSERIGERVDLALQRDGRECEASVNVEPAPR